MYIIGITGGIASGKSATTGLLRDMGADVIDADEIAHRLTSAGGAAAEAIMLRFGTLNRREIGRVVFANEAERLALNAIVHPLVRQEMWRRVQKSTAAVQALEIPLLFESGMEDMTDEVWVIHVPREEQIRRILLRDGLTRAQAESRINSQMPTEEKIKRADIAIDAHGDLASLKEKIAPHYKRALAKAGGAT